MRYYKMRVERLTGEYEVKDLETFTFIEPGQLFRFDGVIYKVVTITITEKIMEV